MNMNINKLTATELMGFCLKVYMVANNVPVLITEEELPLWKTFSDLIVIVEIAKDQSCKYQVSLNTKHQEDTSILLINCLYNEFLPLYYLDHHHLYASFKRNNDYDEIEVPLLEQPFNSDNHKGAKL